ncbi:hypothetical protein LINPERHAP2_LOCUS3195, partial [Linum perenne]
HRFLPSNNVTKDVSKALGPRGIKPESIKESTKSKTGNLPITHSGSAKLIHWFRRNHQFNHLEPSRESR